MNRKQAEVYLQFRDCPLNPTARFILREILSHGNYVDPIVYVVYSRKGLGASTGYSNQTIIRHVDALEACGWLPTVEERRVGLDRKYPQSQHATFAIGETTPQIDRVTGRGRTDLNTGTSFGNEERMAVLRSKGSLKSREPSSLDEEGGTLVLGDRVSSPDSAGSLVLGNGVSKDQRLIRSIQEVKQEVKQESTVTAAAAPVDPESEEASLDRTKGRPGASAGGFGTSSKSKKTTGALPLDPTPSGSKEKVVVELDNSRGSRRGLPHAKETSNKEQPKGMEDMIEPDNKERGRALAGLSMDEQERLKLRNESTARVKAWEADKEARAKERAIYDLPPAGIAEAKERAERLAEATRQQELVDASWA